MGFMDELKKLAKPYSEDDDDFDDFDDEQPRRTPRASRSSAAPAPAASAFDDMEDDFSSGSTSSRRTPPFGGSNGNKVVNIHTTAQMQVVLVKPDRFDNVSDIAEHLRICFEHVVIQRVAVYYQRPQLFKLAQSRCLSAARAAGYADDLEAFGKGCGDLLLGQRAAAQYLIRCRAHINYG